MPFEMLSGGQVEGWAVVGATGEPGSCVQPRGGTMAQKMEVNLARFISARPVLPPWSSPLSAK